MKIEPILIDETLVGQTARQIRAADIDFAAESVLQRTDRCLDIVRDEGGIGTDRLQRARHDPLRLFTPYRGELMFRLTPLRAILVPITHDLVQASTIQTSRQIAHLLDEVTKEHRVRIELSVVHVAVQGLIHTKDELCHAFHSPRRFFRRRYMSSISAMRCLKRQHPSSARSIWSR